MMNPLNQLISAWNEPAMRHAMLVHFPIVLSMIGFPFAVLAAVFGRMCTPIRWIALALYIMLTISAYITADAGDNAHDAVRGSLSEEAHEVLEEHEELGDKVWWFAAGVSLVLVVSLASNTKLRLGAGWLAVAGSMFVAGWVGNTADHGGRLVYEYGTGTPDRVAQLFASAASPAEPSEDRRVMYFREQVRPILVGNCFRCHNPTRSKRSGGLDQTSIGTLLKGGRSGPAIVPGRPDDSLLIMAVRHDDPDLKMPLGEDKLSDESIAALEQWIADGAVWEPFEFTLPATPDPN